VPCRGIVVGYGPEEDRLKKLALDGLPPDSIMFAGKQSDVRPWIKQAYAVVSVSSHEGTSNVYLEAMASGVPVIGLQFDGIEQLITHQKNGLIFKNLEEMTKGCRELLGNLELRNRLGQQARQKIEANHDSKKVVKTFLEITEF
jgi:galacturonosyltransferase